MSQERPIFIDREPSTGDYVMRIPEESIAALYDMLQEAPLASRKRFYKVKQHLEDYYSEELNQAKAAEKKRSN